MRVELKGLNSATVALADGTAKRYWYAWRGGPRLKGEPGSPEFMASYYEAVQARRTPNASQLHSIIVDYRASPEFAELKPRTKADYLQQLAKIEAKFGRMPIRALDDPKVTRVFLGWRDGMRSSPRQADYAWTVLMRLLSWARGRGLTTYRPPERVARLYHADRSEKIWTETNMAAFLGLAPAPLQHAFVLALETGQRQADLLALPWSAYDGTWIRLRQAKTGRHVSVPATRRLRAVLDALPRLSPVILVDARGRPWKADSFRRAWWSASRKAGIEGLTFHDLRGTAVTRLAEAGCTEHEIATITGHALRDVGAILDRYSARTEKIALAAIAKLERGIE